MGRKVVGLGVVLIRKACKVDCEGVAVRSLSEDVVRRRTWVGLTDPFIHV